MVDKFKFMTEGYSISITGKNLEVSDSIKNYVLEKLEKVEKFTDHILDVVVTLEIQKLTHKVRITMKFLHFLIRAEANTLDIYASIDQAVDKLTKLVRKYKNRLQDQNRIEKPGIDLNVSVLFSPETEEEEINEQIAEENLKKETELFKIHEVVEKEKMSLKILTQDEAIMKLELSGDDFLLYRSEEDRKLKIIYRRKDENLAIIEIES